MAGISSAPGSEPGWRIGRRVAIIGSGPGGVSTAMAMHLQGYDVRIYERAAEPKALGGGVLLSVPVLAVLRHYGLDLSKFGSPTRTEFLNHKGKRRVLLDFNPMVEQRMGLKGWHYGVLRSSAFRRMLDRLDELVPGAIRPDHDVLLYEERTDDVLVTFANGQQVAADILIGADGIRSKVSAQAFGDPKLFHVGLRLWLAWCDALPGLPNDLGRIYHSRRVQASYFPMLHNGKEGFEWWVLEASEEATPPPADEQGYVAKLLSAFPDPVPRFLVHTDLDRNMFRWDIYNRPSLQAYTRGRIACVGDAAHPVSPYAAYGMGMAIEDGYFLARALGGRELTRDTIAAGFARYDEERVAYCNGQVEFARFLGDKFHRSGPIAAWLRDLMLDHTPILKHLLRKKSLAESEKMTLAVEELHVR